MENREIGKNYLIIILFFGRGRQFILWIYVGLIFLDQEVLGIKEYEGEALYLKQVG